MDARDMTLKRIDQHRGRLVAAVALTTLLAAAGCTSAQADGAENGGEQSGEEFVRTINVEVTELAPEPFVERIRLTATVTANQDVRIAAEESGTIREILAEKGARVRRGQALFQLNDRVLRAQVAQARAQADLAAETWERRKRLWEEDRVGSEIVYLQAKFTAEQTAANLEALEARLDRTTVRAPFGGVLDERHVDVGSLVSPGQTVGRLVDLDPVKIVGGVPERYAPDVKEGAEAHIAFDVFPGESFTAPITYVGSTVNPGNRTFPIEVVLPNPDGLIKPEMVANMSVTRRQVEEAIVVPQDALVRVEDGYVVFVVTESGEGEVARARPVELGPRQRDQVVIGGGLEAGERIVVVGQKSVADGDRVRVVGARQP